ncbi:MAG: hypothetical protein IKJ74_03300 [Clostridia bacterium]|nr:hypothetical protein [Clostridia bacterium]
MMGAVYGLIEERYEYCGGTRVSYGIAAYADGASGELVLAAAHDIGTDRNRITELVDACNEQKLSAVHLRDVVEDYLCR